MSSVLESILPTCDQKTEDIKSEIKMPTWELKRDNAPGCPVLIEGQLCLHD